MSAEREELASPREEPSYRLSKTIWSTLKLHTVKQQKTTHQIVFMYMYINPIVRMCIYIHTYIYMFVCVCATKIIRVKLYI